MFKKLSLITGLFSIFLIISFSSTVMASGETAYNEIINSYIDYFESDGQVKTLPDDYYFMGLKESTLPEYEWRELSEFGYNLKDLNNDGTKELIVGWGASDDVAVTLVSTYSPEIEAIFTLENSRPKLVINNVNKKPAWANKSEDNNFIEVTADNKIIVEGSYKAYKPENKPDDCWCDKTEFYDFLPDGNLKLEKTYIQDLHADKHGFDYYLIENGVEKTITEAEFDAVTDHLNTIRIDLASFNEHDPIGKNNTSSQQPSNPGDSSSDGIDVFRLYNRLTGEHLYTTDENEANTLSQGDWNNEGIGWKSAKSGEPVYRLYCEVTKAHLFTSDQNEIDSLKASGLWSVDNNSNPIFYSGGSKTIYRLYNESLKMHLLTTDEGEYNSLANQGWNQEGPKFNCQ